MGDSDDPQVFIETFHATALACQLPEAEWVPWLLPTLSVKAQTAALSLPPASRGNFHNVCHTVPPLMFSGQSADRKGAAVRLGTEAAGCSHEMATAWTLGGGDLHVVTHRVGAVCEGAAWGQCAWVRCHRPTSLEAVVTLAEDHLAAGAEEAEWGRQPTCHWPPVPVPQRKLPVPAATERTLAWSPTNPFVALCPSQIPEAPSAASKPRRTAQTLGQECWKCGWQGHLRWDCPVMEV